MDKNRLPEGGSSASQGLAYARLFVCELRSSTRVGCPLGKLCTRLLAFVPKRNLLLSDKRYIQYLLLRGRRKRNPQDKHSYSSLELQSQP